MKYLLVLLALVATCCVGVQYPEPVRRSNATLVREIASQTVALVAEDDDGNAIPFCSGVWVSSTEIVTAAHCARAISGDDADPVGMMLVYIVESEVTGQYTKPTTYHAAMVKRVDSEHDLALLGVSNDAPKHGVARLAVRAPEAGDVLHFIGQAKGFYWTYMSGWMSRMWPDLPGTAKTGPWLQITAPIAGGMSGSGAFDDTGRLVGICSMTTGAPNMGIYVTLETVRAFIGG